MKAKSLIQWPGSLIYHSLRAIVAVCLALTFGSAVALAEEPAKAVDVKSLAKASQNPVAAMISVPIENNATFNNGPDDVYVDILNFKPVMPMGITENWNLINRAIVPIVYQDSGFKDQQGQDLGSQFGLGDMVYQGFISPKKPGKIIWGIGPELHFPTGMDRATTNQWSLGPAAVVLTMPGHWVIGALISNVWNIGNGYDDAPDVNALTAQYFINYNMEGGWYLTTSPVMTADWEADSGDQWTVPVGGGVGRVFKIGKQHVNMRLGAYYNVDAPDGNDDVWNLQFQCNFLFPK